MARSTTKAAPTKAPPDLPKFDQLMWPTIRALKELGGSATVDELITKIVEIEGLSDEAQNYRREGSPKNELNYRSEWTRWYLKKAGVLECTNRRIWTLTSKGRTVSEDDVKRIPAEVRRATNKATPPSDLQSIEETQLPEEPKSSWRIELLDAIQNMPADAFERLAQRLLRESEFVKVEVTGRSGDGGIDGTGVLRVGLISFQVVFQCKRYKGTVGAGAIRDFRGAMVGRSDKGLMVTSGRFTPDAIREATRDGAPPVELIDGDELCDLLKKLRLGVMTETEIVEHVQVNPQFFLEM